MNYIVLNGKRSDQIKGLLIQSLPSIMKPLVRTEIEEIDGRDGDLVTKLGYSAYDKEMLIGLHGKYDIDEVIEYFDSEGTVIFSNEADKYYKYQIIEQIDFERLAHFRQATVTFHVQPFKFSSVDNEIKFSNNYLKVPSFSRQITDDLYVGFNSGILIVRGTTGYTEPTEVYIPCECICEDGILGKTHNTYSVRAKGTGTGLNKVGIRVCNNAPANPATLGYTIMYLDSSKVEQSQTLDETKKYNYLYLYLTPDQTYNIQAKVWVNNDDYKSQEFTNKGNAVSKPIYKIYGSGNISIKMNGVDAFQINNLDLQKYIILDTVEMNAYFNNTYLNRSVSGDFDDLWMKKGINTLSWTGNISELIVDEYSRWI